MKYLSKFFISFLYIFYSFSYSDIIKSNIIDSKPKYNQIDTLYEINKSWKSNFLNGDDSCPEFGNILISLAERNGILGFSFERQRLIRLNNKEIVKADQAPNSEKFINNIMLYNIDKAYMDLSFSNMDNISCIISVGGAVKFIEQGLSFNKNMTDKIYYYLFFNSKNKMKIFSLFTRFSVLFNIIKRDSFCWVARLNIGNRITLPYSENEKRCAYINKYNADILLPVLGIKNKIFIDVHERVSWYLTFNLEIESERMRKLADNDIYKIEWVVQTYIGSGLIFII